MLNDPFILINKSTLIQYTDLVRHSYNVAHISYQIGLTLLLNKNELSRLYYIALCHDLGKLWINKNILYKPGYLNLEEKKLMNYHPLYSEEICKILFNSSSDGVAIRSHHENFDGSGYPFNLKHENIPFESRIISIADNYDALSNPRIYRPFVEKNIKDIMYSESGIKFDPYILKKFYKSLG